MFQKYTIIQNLPFRYFITLIVESKQFVVTNLLENFEAPRDDFINVMLSMLVYDMLLKRPI